MAELLKTFLLIVGVRETVVCAAIILLLGTARYFSSLPNLSGIPWVGKTPGWFLKGEAKRHFIANGASIIDEGYAKVWFNSKANSWCKPGNKIWHVLTPLSAKISLLGCKLRIWTA